MTERLLKLKEVREILGISLSSIHRWDREGKIKVVRTPGGRRRIPESEVKRLLRLGGKGETVICEMPKELAARLHERIKQQYGKETSLEEGMIKISQYWLTKRRKEK